MSKQVDSAEQLKADEQDEKQKLLSLAKRFETPDRPIDATPGAASANALKVSGGSKVDHKSELLASLQSNTNK